MSPKYDTTILPETRHFSKNITLWCFNIKSSLIVNILLFSSQCCQTPVVKRQSNLYTLTSINIFQIHFHHNTDFKENAFIFFCPKQYFKKNVCIPPGPFAQICHFIQQNVHILICLPFMLKKMCSFSRPDTI